MEELTAIKTADGRQFKPWASREDVAEIRSDINTVAVGIDDSLNGLADSYVRLAESIGEMILMTTDEYQPALEDLLNQLN